LICKKVLAKYVFIYYGLLLLSATLFINCSPAGVAGNANLSKIAFISKGQLCLMNSDGSNQTKLDITNAGSFSKPNWSPDGRKIVVQWSMRATQIFVVDISSKKTNITHGDWDGEPAWSPDGKNIAFVSRRDGKDQIYLMNPDCSDQKRISDLAGNDTNPTWSPDGGKIAFTSDRAGKRYIYSMGINGKDIKKFNPNESAGFPSWSPDGSKIAFLGWGPNDDIFVFDPAKNSISMIERWFQDPYQPAWSPDGHSIACASSLKSGGNLLVFDLMSGKSKLITNNKCQPEHVSWSSDGKKIFFDSDYEGNNSIYVFDKDKNSVQRLTNNSWADEYPVGAPYR
jgi:Tol biopolymer transport system component